MDACDPGSESANIRRLVKLHTGKSVSVSRDMACEILKLAKRGSSPLPPLSITRDKKYLLDAKSPLSQKDYEALFSSTVKLKDVKRIAKKAGLLRVDKTIAELREAIGRRLSSMNIREPVMLHKGSVEVIRNTAFNNNLNANLNNLNNLTNLNVNNVNRNRTNNVNNVNNVNRNRTNNVNNVNRNRTNNVNNVNRNRTNNVNRNRTNSVNNKPKSGSNGLLGGMFKNDDGLRRSLAEKRHRERLQRTNSAFRPASMMVPTMRVINNQQRASLIIQKESEKLNIELRNARRQSEILERAATSGNMRAKQLLQESQKKITQLEAARKSLNNKSKVNAANAQKKINELEAARKQNAINANAKVKKLAENANAKAKKAAENAQTKINELNKNRLAARGEISKLQQAISTKNIESRRAINEATRVATEAAKIAAASNTAQARAAATKAETELKNLIAATAVAREQNEKNLKAELNKKNNETRAAISQARAAAEAAASQAIKNQTAEAKAAAQKAKENLETAERKANEQARKNALLLKEVQNASTKLKEQMTANRKSFNNATRQLGESIIKNKQASEAKIANLTRKINEAQQAYNNAVKEGNKKAERAAAEAIQRIRAETNKKVKEANKQLQLAVKTGNAVAIQVAKNNKKNLEQVKILPLPAPNKKPLALPAPPAPNKKPLALPAPPAPNKKPLALPAPNKKPVSTNEIIRAINNAPTIPIARQIMLKSHSNKGGSVEVNMNRVKKAFQKKKTLLALPAPPKNNGIGKKSKNNKLNSIPNIKPTTKSNIYENNNNNEPFKKKTNNPLFQTFTTTKNPLALPKPNNKKNFNANKAIENLNRVAKKQGEKNRSSLVKLLKSTKTDPKKSEEYLKAFDMGRKTFKELKSNIVMITKRNAFIRKRNKPANSKNNNNAATDASKLFNVSGGIKNLTRGKEERNVDKNVLNRTRQLITTGVAGFGGRAREKFLKRGRGVQNTRPLIKELDERIKLRNSIKNLQHSSHLRSEIQNSDILIENVRKSVEKFKKMTPAQRMMAQAKKNMKFTNSVRAKSKTAS